MLRLLMHSAQLLLLLHAHSVCLLVLLQPGWLGGKLSPRILVCSLSTCNTSQEGVTWMGGGGQRLCQLAPGLSCGCKLMILTPTPHTLPDWSLSDRLSSRGFRHRAQHAFEKHGCLTPGQRQT